MVHTIGYDLIALAVGQTSDAVVSSGIIGNDLTVGKTMVDDAYLVVRVVDGIRGRWGKGLKTCFMLSMLY